MTNKGHSEKSATDLEAKSKTLPGVPTNMWTGSFKRMTSSVKLVPPVVTIQLMPKCFPKVRTTWEVCKANSLVGTRIKACVLKTLGFTNCNEGMTKEAVLPVPFLALAKMSLPARAIGIDSSWIGEGFSKPASKIPINNSLFKFRSSNVLPLVLSTSSVWTRVSLTGMFKDSFQFESVIVGML